MLGCWNSSVEDCLAGWRYQQHQLTTSDHTSRCHQAPRMSKGGHGAAAANVLLLKKSEETRRQENMREAIKVEYQLRSVAGDRFIVKLLCNSSIYCDAHSKARSCTTFTRKSTSLSFVYPGRGMSACLQFTKQSTVNHNLTAITPVHLDLEIIFS